MDLINSPPPRGGEWGTLYTPQQFWERLWAGGDHVDRRDHSAQVHDDDPTVDGEQHAAAAARRGAGPATRRWPAGELKGNRQYLKMWMSPDGLGSFKQRGGGIFRI